MSQATDAAAMPKGIPASAAAATAIAAGAAAFEGHDFTAGAKGDEHFIPLTRHAVMERLTRPGMWPAAVVADAERFFRYLEHWRLQQHNTHLIELTQLYEPFSPDSDLFQTRDYSSEERQQMKLLLLEGVEKLLRQANYVRVDPKRVELILTKDSHYGLDLDVDFDAFDELMVYYRGASVQREQRRVLSSFFRKQEFQVPIFRRVFVLFKLKPIEQRIEAAMVRHKLDRKEAERRVQRNSGALHDKIKTENIYMKMFKNMPRTDLEMIFPNTQVKFRSIDKIKFGMTSGGAVGMGVFGTATKVIAGGLTALNPAALGGMVLALGGVAFRQGMAFLNQRQRYMVIMARNLYFHAMADNRGVLTKLAERAAEEDLKEEVLLYSVLAKTCVHESELKSVDKAIENWLADTFGLQIDFDVEDALQRLINDGLVERKPDGTLHALPPGEAMAHVDAMWDRVLDLLPPIRHSFGHEIERSGRVRPNGSGQAA
jgi:hypothetical protein